jgi:hypothetical protein
MKRMVTMQLLAVFGLAVSASAALATGHGGPCCPPGCEHVCRPEIATRKVPKVFYDCKCEPFCLPKCVCGFGKGCHKGCDPCCAPCPVPCPECEKPRVKKLLIKYIKEVDECYVKCTPELVPCCPPCYGAPVSVVPAPAGKPAGELLPPPKVEGK